MKTEKPITEAITEAICKQCENLELMDKIFDLEKIQNIEEVSGLEGKVFNLELDCQDLKTIQFRLWTLGEALENYHKTLLSIEKSHREYEMLIASQKDAKVN